MMLIGCAPCSRRGIFISKGKVSVESPSVRETRQKAAVVASGKGSANRKASMTVPGVSCEADMGSTPVEKTQSQHRRQPGGAHLGGSAFHVVGHPHAGERAVV